MADLVRVSLQTTVTCPHCWHRFSAEDTHWIAAHQDLVNDPRLGAAAQQRFLPTRFTPQGQAIDIYGLPCQDLACPHCHLRLPRAVLELKHLIVSIAGAPACGKSFLLAAMAWQLRRAFPNTFQLSFSDVDPESNRIINDYEEQLFVSSRPDEIVKLAKTQEFGDWYNLVTYDEQTVVYPQPFMFEVRPNHRHPARDQGRRIARLMCLYDNAGESFLPGKDTVTNAVTRHLAAADAWLFCYDPTQDPRFRAACQQASSDPQITRPNVTSRQETLLHEMVSRIQKHRADGSHRKLERPLIVICTKYDAWYSLFDEPRLPSPWRMSRDQSIGVLDIERIIDVSQRLQELLNVYSPDLVSRARSLSSRVWFLPVSATGTSVVVDEDGRTGVRSRDLNPMWCEVPMLLALAESSPGLVPISRQKAATDAKAARP